MRIKKKCVGENLLLYIENENKKLNFPKLLKYFKIDNIYVELLEFEHKEIELLEFLESKNIKYFKKSRQGLNYCMSLPEENFDAFFKEIYKYKFEELKIWNANFAYLNMEDNSNCDNTIFYINHMIFRFDYCEIICDNKFDDDNLEVSLTEYMADN